MKTNIIKFSVAPCLSSSFLCLTISLLLLKKTLHDVLKTVNFEPIIVSNKGLVVRPQNSLKEMICNKIFSESKDQNMSLFKAPNNVK